MLYLDNDVLRKFASPDPDPKVVDYLNRHRSEPWGISTVVLYEFLSYYESPGTRQERLHTLDTRVVDDIASFDKDAAVEAARATFSALKGRACRWNPVLTTRLW